MDSRVSETRARMKITPREKGETRGMSLCLALGDFHARSGYARTNAVLVVVYYKTMYSLFAI